MHLRYIVIGAAIVVLIVLVAIAWWYSRQKRREQLREQFGPEYERTVRERGSDSAAQAELSSRTQRVRQLDIRPLSAADQSRFSELWRQVQTRFVDDPSGAVADADGLVGEVMQTRGYPMSDFDQRAADVSVDHPRVVDNYRRAHDIAEREQAGQATTEDLRQAMVHYRSLFDELLGADRPSAAATTTRPGRPAGQTR